MAQITALPTITAIEFFAKRFVINRETGCWEWIGHISKVTGYGFFSYKYGYGHAHRWFYKIFWGVQLDKKQVCDHLCRVKHCVNPAHIEIVDDYTNTMRGIGPTSKYAKQTHCKYGHEYTPDNTYSPSGTRWRYCKTCRRRRDIERRKQDK